MSASPARRPLTFALQAMGGSVLASPGPVESRTFAGAATDNRLVTADRLFFALPGERADGFEFCASAAASGAAAVVVPRARGVPQGCEGVPVIGVKDTRAALADLARAVRAGFRGKVVGITGSNGKTTTKELVAAALGASGPVLRTAGNLNTDVGLPLTILEGTGEERFWVLEMAMRARGEIALLADIAVPHVGMVTNVAAAHLGRLGSLEEVARAKGEIYSGLAEGGIAVLPAGEPLLEAEVEHLPGSRTRRFGAWGPKPTGPIAEPGDVRILDFVPSGVDGSVVRFAVHDEPVVVRLPLAGEHNARNAAAALTVILALGLPVRPAAAALGRVELPPHRSRTRMVGGRIVLDDCYNANPASMAAALRTLVTSAGGPGQAFAVMGDMLELGSEAEAMHAETGRLAASLRLGGVVAVGPLATHIARAAREAGLSPDRVLATDEPGPAAAAVAGWSRQGDWVLVKGSRGMRLERVIEALEARLGGAAPAIPPPAEARGPMPSSEAARAGAAPRAQRSTRKGARKAAKASPKPRGKAGKARGQGGARSRGRTTAKARSRTATKSATRSTTKSAPKRSAKASGQARKQASLRRPSRTSAAAKSPKKVTSTPGKKRGAKPAPAGRARKAGGRRK